MNRRVLFLLTATTLFAARTAPLAAWDRLWVDQFASSSFIGGYGGAADASGVYAAGTVFGELPGTTPIGAVDAYVRKVDKSGSVLWTRRLGTAVYDDAQDVAAH